MMSSTTSSTYVSTLRSGTMLNLRNHFRPDWPDPEASICNEHSWLYVKGNHYWSIKGPALQAYNTVKGKIKDCVIERERELYEDQDESSVPHWIDCLMVGRTTARARPYVVISCGQERFCKKLKRIIKGSTWWREFDERCRGFGGFLLLSFMPRRMADENANTHKSWVYTSQQTSTLCGAPIFFAPDRLGLDDACRQRQATFGNIIYLDGQPFGVTVAHPLVDQGHDNVSDQFVHESDVVVYMDDSDDESSSESSSAFSSASNKMDVSKTTPSEEFVRFQRLEGSPCLLGRLVCRSDGTSADGADWALIALNQDRGTPLPNSTTTIGTHLDSSGSTAVVQTPQEVACLSENVGRVFTTGGKNGLIEGFLSANESLVCLPRSRQYLSLYSVILSGGLVPGDCGKWVFDHRGNWYGHVVASIPGTEIAYVAPASLIIDDIRTRTGITSLSLTGSLSHDWIPLTNKPSSSWESSERRGLQISTTHIEGMELSNETQTAMSAPEEAHLNALYTASACGREKVVQMLLDAEVDVNDRGRVYGIALQAASLEGHEKIVQILVDSGADVNAQRGLYGNALQAASRGAHEKIVKILVDAGADVNAQGGLYGNALYAASRGGQETVVQILVEAGADANARGGEYGNALQAASRGGHENIVQILVEAGADVNARGGAYSNALYAASREGHEKIVQMLVDAGADVNARGG